MGGEDAGEIHQEDAVHCRAVQQLLHQQHPRQWEGHTGDIATVTIKTTGWSFYVRIYVYFYDEVVQSVWTE